MRPRPDRLGMAALAVCLALALVGVLAPALGWRLDVVQSGSMSPAIGVGDLVIVSPFAPDSARAGDIICFRSGSAMVCHRVVSVDEINRTLVTKGDANEHADPSPVSFDDVTGKVALNVPFLGYVVSFLHGPFGWALMVLLIALVLVTGGGKDSEKKETELEEGKG